MEKEMEDLVQVLVPKSRLLDVYELLSRPVGSRQDGSDISKEVPEEDAPGQAAWPPEMLERHYRRSSPPLKRFLDHLADNPGRAVPIGELDEAVGYKPHQTAGMLSAASRRVSNRYGLKHPWVAGKRRDDGAKCYTMNEEDAAVVRSLRTDR